MDKTSNEFMHDNVEARLPSIFLWSVCIFSHSKPLAPIHVERTTKKCVDCFDYRSFRCPPLLRILMSLLRGCVNKWLVGIATRLGSYQFRGIKSLRTNHILCNQKLNKISDGTKESWNDHCYHKNKAKQIKKQQAPNKKKHHVQNCSLSFHNEIS